MKNTIIKFLFLSLFMSSSFAGQSGNIKTNKIQDFFKEIKKIRTYYFDYSTDNRIMAVSMHQTENKEVFLDNNMVPIGSAALTNSGRLESTGIKAIAHAASGSMTSHSGIYKPSLDGVIKSVMNSILVTKKKGYKSIAIPFIGGGIFLSSINKTKEELANAIITTAIKYNKGLNISFVAYSNDDYAIFQKVFNEVLQNYSKGSRIKDFLLTRSKIESRVNVLQGSITNYELHGSEVIVNAANTELLFGGGLSGFIGRQTSEATLIDTDCDRIKTKLSDFYTN